jgi:enoyl-CoA hydratase
MADMILVETHGRVGLIRLHRPQALNALCDQLMAELGAQLLAFDDNPAIGAIVLTGSEKAFAAGADIKEMQNRTYPAVLFDDFIARWETVTTIKTPVIAAVSGFALGGGCELAMMCDFVVCAENAKFGQPEILLGVIPGSGGTQRLTRLVGKSKALVSRIFPTAELVARAIELGERIASLSPVANYAAKRAVNAAYETMLREGVQTERMLFLPLFGTADQKEGMSAFIDKRKAAFNPRS